MHVLNVFLNIRCRVIHMFIILSTSRFLNTGRRQGCPLALTCGRRHNGFVCCRVPAYSDRIVADAEYRRHCDLRQSAVLVKVVRKCYCRSSSRIRNSSHFHRRSPSDRPNERRHNLNPEFPSRVDYLRRHCQSLVQRSDSRGCAVKNSQPGSSF